MNAPESGGIAGGNGTVAITGATGFIGPYLIDAFHTAGWRVKALTRRGPQDDKAEWVAGDLTNDVALDELTRGADLLVHAAGAIRGLNRDAFFAANVTGTETVALAAQASGVKHVIHLSSQAAREPRLSHYSASKAAAELVWRRIHPATILRPPAVYGPGDTETLKIFKAVKTGFVPAPAPDLNRFSMIHAADVAQAVLTAAKTTDLVGKILELDDGTPAGYSIRDVAEIASGILGCEARVIPIPGTLISSAGFCSHVVAQLTRNPTVFTHQKAREICHADWSTNRPTLSEHSDWRPKYDLRTGFAETLDWYREKEWL